MWDSFKQLFFEGYHDLVEETKVTNGYTGFHSAYVMKYM